jgi:hypothetical protein
MPPSESEGVSVEPHLSITTCARVVVPVMSVSELRPPHRQLHHLAKSSSNSVREPLLAMSPTTAAETATEQGKLRVSVDFTPAAYEVLRGHAKDMPMDAFVREAIILEKMARECIDSGGHVIFRKKNGETRELVLR